LNLPVPVWGIIGYGFLLLCLLSAGSKRAQKKRMWAMAFWLSLIFTGYSVILSLISAFLIDSYCIMCIVLHTVNLILLFYTWIIRRRFSAAGLVKDTKEDFLYMWANRTWNMSVLSLFMISALTIWIFYPVYWHFNAPPLSDKIPSGMTESGHPYIGAEAPALEIMEFADYQCFQCKKMHFFLRQLVAEHTDKLRLIHRHYPMDHSVNPIVKEPFHEGSGAMALIAVAAARMNKFWPVNDYLFGIAGKTDAIDIRELAQKVGLDVKALQQTMNERKTLIELRRDIWKGNKLKITGTPAFVIDGEVYLGHIPPEIIRKVLQ
jgi:protein-disulfide isomerase